MSRTPQSRSVLVLFSLITISALGVLAGSSTIERAYSAATPDTTEPTLSGPSNENRSEVLIEPADSTDNTPSPCDKDKIEARPASSSDRLEETPPLPAATLVRSVHLHQSDDTVRVVVATNGFAHFEDFTLSDPTRIVVDVIGVRNTLRSRTIDTGTPSITRVRVGQPRPGIARIALDINGQVTYRVIREGALLIIAARPSEEEPTVLNRNESALFELSTDIAGQNIRELRGTVKDQQGDLVVNALITLDDHQGHTYSSQTDEHGNFRFASIVPGSYRMEVAAEGFAKHTQQVDLTSRRIVPINVTLQVVISERLEVQPEAPRISTEPDENLSAITLSGTELEALPDDPNQLLRLLREMAGVSGGQAASVYVDGFRESRLPPKASIQTIRIDSNPFAAEFSEPGHSRIEVTTKPGSNQVHGEFRLNFNDESLNARNSFAPSRDALQLRNYSGYLSGPIIHHRLDFTTYLGRWEQDGNEVVNATILDPRTLSPHRFAKTVLTPARITTLSVTTKYLVGKNHNLVLGYSHTLDEALNQGLQSGFDLPERAFNRSARSDSIRMSLISVANKRMVNEFRMELSRYSYRGRSIVSSPATLVLDAFNGGGNQGSLFLENSNDSLRFAENLTYKANSHTFKIGARVDALRLANIDRSNFGGTFTFGTDFERDERGNLLFGTNGKPLIISALENYRRTLLGLPGYRPSLFSIVRGDPFIALSQWEIGWFVQDDWRLSPRLTISYGLRHEFQTHLDDRINFAPRVGFAWSPAQKSVIRAGAGLFYSGVESGITLESTRLDGRHQQQLVIQRPTFFSDLPPDSGLALTGKSTIRIKDPALEAPSLFIANVTYERQLAWRMFGSVGYTWQRGRHLLRTRNIGVVTRQPSDIDQFPDIGPILQFESTGRSTRHQLRLTARENVGRTLSVFANYTLSSTRSDTEGALSAPADSNDLSTEFGRANNDQRHRFFIGASVSPFWGLQVSPFVSVASGGPFNIRTGRDSNGDTLFTDRPAFASPGQPNAVLTPFGLFNPDPGIGDIIIPRNFGAGPGQVNVSLNLAKTLKVGAGRPIPSGGAQSAGSHQQGASGLIGGSPRSQVGEPRVYSLTFSANIENLINHTNFAGFNGVLRSPFFGKANRALGARRIDVGLRFAF
ncbi:MAG TPA: carboxypeptidase regulatory-like domain-containing protein [Blastocatellia bacterium]|nr:carboxypeptidase regulatory-like domain-containing protein [Blastocatellia bacterium]